MTRQLCSNSTSLNSSATEAQPRNVPNAQAGEPKISPMSPKVLLELAILFPNSHLLSLTQWVQTRIVNRTSWRQGGHIAELALLFCTRQSQHDLSTPMYPQGKSRPGMNSRSASIPSSLERSSSLSARSWLTLLVHGQTAR